MKNHSFIFLVFIGNTFLSKFIYTSKAQQSESTDLLLLLTRGIR